MYSTEKTSDAIKRSRFQRAIQAGEIKCGVRTRKIHLRQPKRLFSVAHIT